jgi:hypothetical protein
MKAAPPFEPKYCRCGRAYSMLDTWRALPLVGYMPDEDETDLELRNCPCGSTIAIVVERRGVR